MQLGKLKFSPIEDDLGLVAKPVADLIKSASLKAVLVSAIDPNLADTVAFCEHYDIGMDVCANCVIVEAKRADKIWYAACLVLATTRADVNGVVRRQLDARKISFAPMDKAVELTGMEYGGITPIGLPAGWPIFIDSAVRSKEKVIIGSGIRGSKLLVSPETLEGLVNTVVLDITKSD